MRYARCSRGRAHHATAQQTRGDIVVSSLDALQAGVQVACMPVLAVLHRPASFSLLKHDPARALSVLQCLAARHSLVTAADPQHPKCAPSDTSKQQGRTWRKGVSSRICCAYAVLMSSCSPAHSLQLRSQALA